MRCDRHFPDASPIVRKQDALLASNISRIRAPLYGRGSTAGHNPHNSPRANRLHSVWCLGCRRHTITIWHTEPIAASGTRWTGLIPLGRDEALPRNRATRRRLTMYQSNPPLAVKARVEAHRDREERKDQMMLP